MSLPFLLIANYAQILASEEGYKRQLIRNGAAMAAIFLVFEVFFNRYIVGTLSLVSLHPEQTLPQIMRAFRRVVPFGFVDFNIFVDLFLCTLFMYFLNHRPAHVFKGRWILLFRLFAVLPVAYEVGSIVLKGMAASGAIELPAWVFPLLTVKPPMSFMVFIVLSVFIKTREFRFRRHGRTDAEYRAFVQTNRNSLHFSTFMAITLVVASIIDILILVFLLEGELGSLDAVETVDLGTYKSAAMAMGFGGSVTLMLIAPLVLLFSYTRNPGNSGIGAAIPIAGIALIAIIIIQGSYQLLCVAGLPRVDIQMVLDKAEAVIAAIGTP